jgi:hypothetical protein
LSPQKRLSFELQQNPVQQLSIPLKIYTATSLTASIRIYSLDGRLLIDVPKQSLQKGYTAIQLPAAGLKNALYMAVLSTQIGTFQQKIVINRG